MVTVIEPNFATTIARGRATPHVVEKLSQTYNAHYFVTLAKNQYCHAFYIAIRYNGVCKLDAGK